MISDARGFFFESSASKIMQLALNIFTGGVRLETVCSLFVLSTIQSSTFFWKMSGARDLSSPTQLLFNKQRRSHTTGTCLKKEKSFQLINLCFFFFFFLLLLLDASFQASILSLFQSSLMLYAYILTRS